MSEAKQKTAAVRVNEKLVGKKVALCLFDGEKKYIGKVTFVDTYCIGITLDSGSGLTFFKHGLLFIAEFESKEL